MEYDVKENKDSGNSSDNIIDEIYEKNNSDIINIKNSEIDENINNNNFEELNYIRDINNDETKEIIELFIILYLDKDDIDNNSESNRFKLPLKKRIESKLNKNSKKF